MKRIRIIALLLLITSFSFAQDNESLLTVEGSSSFYEKPDVVLVQISLNEKDSIYSHCIDKVLVKIENIKNKLKANNIDIGLVKTQSFNIADNSNYTSYEQLKNEDKYMATVELELEYGYSEEFIKKIFNVLRENNTQVAFNMSYKFSKPLKDKIVDRLMKEAIDDAKRKANILSTASGYSLQGIKSINYGSGFGVFPSNFGSRREGWNVQTSNANAIGCTFDFCPAEIELQDNVSIEWYILKK